MDRTCRLLLFSVACVALSGLPHVAHASVDQSDLPVIVVASPAPPQLLLAARDLRRYLHHLTGQRLPITLLAADKRQSTAGGDSVHDGEEEEEKEVFASITQALAAHKAGVLLLAPTEHLLGEFFVTRSPSPLLSDLLSIAAGHPSSSTAALPRQLAGLAERHGRVLSSPSSRHSTAHDTFLLHAQVVQQTTPLLVCTGTTTTSTVYAVYTLLEHAGIRFRLHGDVLPPRNSVALPTLLAELVAHPGMQRLYEPVTDLRGIQPFHDFSEGPDWWNLEEYKLHLAQMVKMKFNFIGLHTYPLTEPTVWTGLTKDIGVNGTVTQSYPTHYMSALLGGDWGGVAMNTSSYLYGSYLLFPTQGQCADAQDGLCPVPTDAAGANTLFNRVGDMLTQAFAYAHAHGIKTCVGTETPLAIPQPSGGTSQDYYEGIFTRIMQMGQHLDYYWFWTPENWEWDQVNVTDPVVQDAVKDMQSAYAAAKAVQAPFGLATCGWVLGPLGARAYLDGILPEDVAMSSINMNVGNTPPDPAYANVTHHAKWSIPWMEDDPGLSALQLWVNRTIVYSDQAVEYGCTGLMGIHWRTKAVSPQFAALATYPWQPNVTDYDVYRDLVVTEFGLQGGAADAAASLMVSFEGNNLPRPVTWDGGPGKMEPNPKPWAEVQQQYAFVDKFVAIGEAIVDPVYQERFNYWANMLRHLRALAKAGCDYGVFNTAMAKAANQTDPEAQQRVAEAEALPARIALVQSTGEMMNYLMQTTSTTGGLGTIANLQQHSFPDMLVRPASVLEGYLGYALPQEAQPPAEYGRYMPAEAVPRMFVLSPRTSLQQQEQLVVTAMVLVPQEPDEVVVWLRPLSATANDDWKAFPMPTVKAGRHVYRVTVDALSGDVEYWVAARVGGAQLVWPAGAPGATHTVIIEP